MKKSCKRDRFYDLFRSSSSSSSQNASPNANLDITIADRCDDATITELTKQPSNNLANKHDGNLSAKENDPQKNKSTMRSDEQQEGAFTGNCNEQVGSKDLWMAALENLPMGRKSLLEEVGIKSEIVSGKQEFLEELLMTAKEAQVRCEARRWKLKWGQRVIDVREKAEAITGWIESFKHIGDIAIQFNPVYTALPWAGVRFILTVLISGEENMAAAVVGMERVTMLVSRCMVYEQLYLTSEVSPTVARATEDLRRALVNLYTAILIVLSLFLELFMSGFVRRTVASLKNPGEVLEKIKLLDGLESTVNIAADAVDKCYQLNLNKANNDEFNALKKLLNCFEPIVGRIDSTMGAMYKSIEESERIKVLTWLSEVPYQSHHDLAQEGRVDGTGDWLFARAEFCDWWQAENLELLWLQGIPGAGKTKLMSAAIDYLQVKTDKVAFFYCKRDERDRHDRNKILLSLIKQLACPNSRTICKPAIEAYQQQQQDPSAREHLPATMSIKLIIKLLECYQHPVIILDALDECSEDVRCFILEAIISIINSNRSWTVKVLVSSRLSLDIQDSLKNVPYVSIEARDNAQDIRNYVEMELDRRIKSKQLLRGEISASLRDQIQQVLLRDAHGMFLWVEYQIHDLCKLRLEKDIRSRLGKLPKSLSGVYDEIMTAINSQEGSGPLLAERALKWMLVSCRPLTPREIIAAIALDPSISLSTDISDQEPAVEIEVVLSFCGGLRIWDRGLDVIRFAHLSVNEYLETQRHQWDIIDAQLHVAEACLWTLQGPRRLEVSNEKIEQVSPLYPYSAMHWFRHCRSYQDLVLLSSSRSVMQGLEIPLLNSFLSSFDEVTASYMRWVDWLLDSVFQFEKYKIGSAVKSAPAFAAALGGLGQLVSWLWQSESADMNIKTACRWDFLATHRRCGRRRAPTC